MPFDSEKREEYMASQLQGFSSRRVGFKGFLFLTIRIPFCRSEPVVDSLG